MLRDENIFFPQTLFGIIKWTNEKKSKIYHHHLNSNVGIEMKEKSWIHIRNFYIVRKGKGFEEDGDLFYIFIFQEKRRNNKML